jgi:glycosyltransferase involved in cell wall biosynthesis
VEENSNTMLSIVVPVHNMAGRLENLENSLKMTQELGLPIQFVLVQDGKDSGTQKELSDLSKKYHAVFIEVDLGSPGLARNAGIEFCNSPWIAFWDSDDQGNPHEVMKEILQVMPKKKVIVGSFREMDLEKCQLSRLRKPSRFLSSLMINPGIWRFVFKRDFVGENRFPKSSMGEDQVFLAKLQIDSELLMQSSSSFYTYFTNVPNQLTSRTDKILNLTASIIEVNKIIELSAKTRMYVFTIRAKMYLSASKRKLIARHELIHSIVGNTSFSSINKLKCLVGFVFAIAATLKQDIFTA